MKLIILVLISYFALGSCKQQKGDELGTNLSLDSTVQSRQTQKFPNATGNLNNMTDIIYNDSLKCNVNFLVKYSEAIDSVTEEDIIRFLYTFDESCNHNAEFSEFSNELLFESLYRYPGQVVKLLSYEGIKNKVVLEKLKSPINDKYNISTILTKINKVEDCKMKIEVEKSLAFAQKLGNISY